MNYKPIMTKFLINISIILLFWSCKNNNQIAREPVQHQKSHVDMESVRHNKALNRREEAYILKMIAQDSIHHYINSGNGFWFYYLKQNQNTKKHAEAGDQISLNYEIKDLSGNIIYSFDEIGNKTYHVDHENYFRGFREAVKLLKEGESAVFFFPSNAAYGFHGDEKKIGTNVPLIVELKIKKIDKQKTN